MTYHTVQCFTLKLPRPLTGIQVLLEISAYNSNAIGLLLGNIHPSELEKVDKPSATARIEPTIIISSVDTTSHSAIPSQLLFGQCTLISNKINAYRDQT